MDYIKISLVEASAKQIFKMKLVLAKGIPIFQKSLKGSYSMFYFQMCPVGKQSNKQECVLEVQEEKKINPQIQQNGSLSFFWLKLF